MRRRSFVAALPLAAVASTAFAQTATSRRADAPAPGAVPLPGFQNSDAVRFERPDVHAGDRPVGASFASRSAALGVSGAAGTAHPLATLAAIETLKRGGSAVDGAVAANACLGFLEPTSAGLGGDCYAMLWDPKLSKVVGVAGSGRSPKSLSLDIVRARSPQGTISALGAISVSVPGALDAWWTLHQRYGNLPWKDLFEPAIAYCESGVPLPQIISYYIKRNLDVFNRSGAGIEETANANATYAPGGRAPAEGVLFRNSDLARTYRLIAQGGRDAYYKGPIAQTIDAYFKRIGGWLSVRGPAAHHGEWTEPLVTTLSRRRRLCDWRKHPGPRDPADAQHPREVRPARHGISVGASIHLQMEAKRLAYEDRARYYADPHFAGFRSSG